MSQTFNPDEDVEVIEKTTPYEGHFRIDAYRLRHRKYDGTWSRELPREVFERGHAGSAILYDPHRDTVVMIEQFRPGAYAAGHYPWLLEVVAGVIEPGETPEEVVRREALEEAGLIVADLEPIGKFMITPGGSSETAYLFCGRVDSGLAEGYHGLSAEDEDIRVVVLTFDTVARLLRQNRLLNVTAVLATQWLSLHRGRLQVEWGS